MPKKEKIESVLCDWVHELTFQMQALLLTAMRGPDGCDKHNSAKEIVRYLRGVVIKPAGKWACHKTMPLGLNDNDFMWGEYDKFPATSRAFWNDHDAYPHHFIMHLVHCAEVVGYKHPDEKIRWHWGWFYKQACKSFHMKEETEQQLDERLNDFGCGVHNNPDYQTY